jgi:hypothetical protein
MRTTHRFIVLSLALLQGCGGGGEGTAEDTEVLSWTRSTYTTMDDIQLGDDVGEGTEMSKVIVVTPKPGGMCDPSYDDVRLQLDAEFGEVQLHMGDSRHLIPRTVAVTVLQNDVWEVEGECEPQIRIPLEVEVIEENRPAVPRVLFASCEVTLRRGEDAHLVSIELAGDQNIEVSAGFDEVRVE